MRRNHRNVCLGVGVLLPCLFTSTAASAKLIADPENATLYNAYKECRSRFVAAGVDGYLADLETRPDRTINVMQCSYSETDWRLKEGAEDGIGTDSTVCWDLIDAGSRDGCPIDMCATLFHELAGHAARAANGQDFKHTRCDNPEGLDSAEVYATRAENEYRNNAPIDADHPSRCQRDYYDGKALPGQKSLTGGCPSSGCVTCKEPPVTVMKPFGPWAYSSGPYVLARAIMDPHMRTGDAVYYDFHAVGEFILVKSTVDDLQVQTRLAPPYPNEPYITQTVVVAARVGADTVEVRGGWNSGVALLVNGAPVPQPAAGWSLAGGGSVSMLPDGSLDVRWADGSSLAIHVASWFGLNVEFSPAATRAGALEGLLGNFDGVASNDLRVRGGALLSNPPTDSQLYPTFADSWRVSGSTTLFTYAAGESTATYTDLAAPTGPAPTVAPEALSTGQSICSAAGVDEPTLMTWCKRDVALTGQPSYANAAAKVQAATPLEASVAVGATVSIPFYARAGRRVFIDVPQATFTNGTVEVYDPTGTFLSYTGVWTASGVISSGRGFWETRPMPATGTYQLKIKNTGGAPGSAVFRIHSPVDPVKALTVDGGPESVTVGTPGAEPRLKFTATEGDTIVIDGTSTLPEIWGAIRLKRDDEVTEAKPGWSGNVTSTGNVIFNNGGSASYPFTLPITSGGPKTYVILVDPPGGILGRATISVHH